MFGERGRERERVKRLFKLCRNLPARHCYAGCMLFKRCWNLPAGTVLQGYRLLKRCRNLPAGNCVAGLQAVSAVLEPTCRALCCRGAGCLSGVGTYLPGTVLHWCRLLKPCQNLPARHCVAGFQAAEEVSEPTCWALCCRGAGWLGGVGTYLPGTVFQVAGCLSGI